MATDFKVDPLFNWIARYFSFLTYFLWKIDQNIMDKISIKTSWTVDWTFFSLSWQIFVKASLEVNETQQQQHPNNVYHDLGITRNKIVTAQFECYQKIMNDNTQSREGSLLCFMFLKLMKKVEQTDHKILHLKLSTSG